jgi:hypothetical protein
MFWRSAQSGIEAPSSDFGRAMLCRFRLRFAGGAFMLLKNRTETAPVPTGARADHVVKVARLRLAASAYPALRRLDCCFHEGVFTVRGRVSTFHERQMAWIVLCDLAGIEEFIDRVEVIEPMSGRKAKPVKPDAMPCRAR